MFGQLIIFPRNLIISFVKFKYFWWVYIKINWQKVSFIHNHLFHHIVKFDIELDVLSDLLKGNYWWGWKKWRMMGENRRLINWPGLCVLSIVSFPNQVLSLRPYSLWRIILLDLDIQFRFSLESPYLKTTKIENGLAINSQMN